MGPDLKERVIMVTGAGSGIGRAAALLFAQAGGTVVSIDIDRVSAEKTCSLIAGEGKTASALQVDVRSEEQVAASVATVVGRHGRLDGAFNNAGVNQHHMPLHELSIEQWRDVIDVDLTGVFLCIKHQVRAMMDRGGGSIVNTASGLGQVAMPNAAEYIAAKHGVIGLTRAAAADYAKYGIRVNAVLPGVTTTPMIERILEDADRAQVFEKYKERHLLGRFANPEEIAHAALWLLSDASGFVTGINIPVDGGYLAV